MQLQQKNQAFAKGLRFLTLSGALLGSGLAWAQDAANTAASAVANTAASTAVTTAVTSAPVTDSPMAGHLLQTTLGLLFVIALLLGLVWLLKRMGIGNQQRRGGFYKVLATSALGPREKIVLVEIGDTWLVLGMTSHSINTLHSMPAGSLEIDNIQSPAVTFAKLLERVKTGKVAS